VRHLQPELSDCGLTVVGGRFSPNFTEFFVLTPVPPLTALERRLVVATTQGKKWTVLYRSILLIWMNLVKLAS
jgi:hypothetical protein